MRKMKFQKGRAFALVIAGILAATPVFADKPAWAGGGKGGKHEWKDRQKHDRHQDRDHDDWASHDRDGPTRRGHFDDRQRAYVHDYYAGQFRAGHCPPGLAKKHNGCLPPGQARKWALRRPLPQDVVLYNLPSPVAMRIGVPPAGYRYVRVDNDILLIAAGTRMVMDAILDLGGRR